MRKPTLYEWAALFLCAGFLVCCAGWLASHTTTSPGWQVCTERSETAVIQPPDSTPYPDGLLDGEIIDLNLASRSDLLRLPDIGAVRAEAILAYRSEHGQFHSVDDLLNVFGIGPTTLERLRPYICAG